MRDAEVRYAERNGDYLAYSVFGPGSDDLAMMQSRTPIDLMWDLDETEMIALTFTQLDAITQTHERAEGDS